MLKELLLLAHMSLQNSCTQEASKRSIREKFFFSLHKSKKITVNNTVKPADIYTNSIFLYIIVYFQNIIKKNQNRKVLWIIKFY